MGKKSKSKSKSNKPAICTQGASFEECELEILHHAISKAEEKQKQQSTNGPEINKIMGIVEDFIRKKKLIVYGGTAQNNILPKADQFYDTSVDIPDYDFFSPDAINDVKELADVYAKAGYIEVDAKSGVHQGTYKLFVNFIPTADVTQMPQSIFDTLQKDTLKIAGITYAPPNFLRMGMYLELSRPDGDVSRWEKVYKRLVLLNKHYPLSSKQCAHVEFQRKMYNTDASQSSKHISKSKSKDISNEEIYDNILKTFVNQDVVFFGGYAISKYSQYMPHHIRSKLQKIPDFDVLSEDAGKTADIAKERLEDIGLKNVTVHKFDSIGEIVSGHFEVRVGKDTIAFIYQPTACHSYNVLHEGGNDIRVATIDTMLSFYLAFLYADKEYYDPNRILCMSKYLFDVQAKNRLSQKGLLRRFSIACIGHQETLEEMREEKSKMYKKLSTQPGSKEYEKWFFRYRPSDKGKKKVVATTTAVGSRKKPHSKTRTQHHGQTKKKHTQTNKHKKKRRKTQKNMFRIF